LTAEGYRSSGRQKRQRNDFCTFFFLSFILVVSGCTGSREVPTHEKHRGLDTIPFYRKGDLGFDTKAALSHIEREKKEEERIRKEIEGGIVDVSDPRLPPTTRRPSDLPPALRGFPKDKFGYPDWTKAVKQGLIKPSGTLLGGKETAAAFDRDILMVINDRLMADVMFPHETHTFWLSCQNCHPAIFKPKKGANEFGMNDIWEGEYCGRCHGIVAFQAKGFENCQRCHSVNKRGRRR
jgi:c(7)-type cytochrome triheme protein